MESLPTPFLQTGQGNFPSTVTFPAFSPLIIVFILVTYTLNPFDTSASFLACSHPFRLSSVSLINVKSSAQSSFSGHHGPISGDSASSTMIKNTEP